MNQINMAAFGFSDRFAALTKEYADLTIGRILSQEKRLYRVISEHGEQLGEISGKFRYEAQSVSDFPAVGDFVMLDCNQSRAERWQSYQKLSAENAYAEDAESYLAAKAQKFKNIAKVNKLNRR